MAGLTQDEESNRIIILGSLAAVAIHDAKGRNERRSVTAVEQTYTQVAEEDRISPSSRTPFNHTNPHRKPVRRDLPKALKTV